MTDGQFLPTGPKIHPESTRDKAFEDFLKRHKDRSEVLSDHYVFPPLVVSIDIARADALHAQGKSYNDAAREAQGIIFARLLPQFEKLTNGYKITSTFLEQYLREKINLAWLEKQDKDYGVDDKSERKKEGRKILARYGSLAEQTGIEEADIPNAHSKLLKQTIQSRRRLDALQDEVTKLVRRR